MRRTPRAQVITAKRLAHEKAEEMDFLRAVLSAHGDGPAPGETFEAYLKRNTVPEDELRTEYDRLRQRQGLPPEPTEAEQEQDRIEMAQEWRSQSDSEYGPRLQRAAARRKRRR